MSGLNRRDACLEHFRQRCAQRGVDVDIEALVRTIERMAPCWRRAIPAPGQDRYTLRILPGGVRPVLTVVWDDTLGVPVTAWWPWDDDPDYCDSKEVA